MTCPQSQQAWPWRSTMIYDFSDLIGAEDADVVFMDEGGTASFEFHHLLLCGVSTLWKSRRGELPLVRKTLSKLMITGSRPALKQETPAPCCRHCCSCSHHAISYCIALHCIADSWAAGELRDARGRVKHVVSVPGSCAGEVLEALQSTVYRGSLPEACSTEQLLWLIRLADAELMAPVVKLAAGRLQEQPMTAADGLTAEQVHWRMPPAAVGSSCWCCWCSSGQVHNMCFSLQHSARQAAQQTQCNMLSHMLQSDITPACWLP